MLRLLPGFCTCLVASPSNTLAVVKPPFIEESAHYLESRNFRLAKVGGVQLTGQLPCKSRRTSKVLRHQPVPRSAAG